MTTPAASAIVPKARVTPNLPVGYAEAMAAEAAAMKSRIGAPSGDFIRINKDKTFQLPNGDTSPIITGIVVDFVSYNQFYPGKYDPKDIKPPTCQALGLEIKTMKPFAQVTDKQNDDCATCWASQWGSDGKGKKCKDQRLLALLAPSLQAEGPLMLIKVSPTGGKYWDNHVGSLARLGNKMPHEVVTEISFDEKSEFTSLRFRLVGPNDNFADAYARRTEARARLLTEPEMAPAEVHPAPGKK